jgi:hypothetical protein
MLQARRMRTASAGERIDGPRRRIAQHCAIAAGGSVWPQAIANAPK